MQVRALLRISVGASFALPAAHAAHGLDNNWVVSISGKKDGNACFQFTGEVEDLGLANLPHVFNDSQAVTCVSGTETCKNDYDACAAAAKKPTTFAGCTLETSSATDATVAGYILDGSCYKNFIVDQKNFNGAPGLAPDKVYLRTETELHTRACLLVNYCSKTGFHLVDRPSAGGNYAQVVQLDAASAELIFDWLVAARHTAFKPAPRTAEGLAVIAARAVVVAVAAGAVVVAVTVASERHPEDVLPQYHIPMQLVAVQCGCHFQNLIPPI